MVTRGSAPRITKMTEYDAVAAMVVQEYLVVCIGIRAVIFKKSSNFEKLYFEELQEV